MSTAPGEGGGPAGGSSSPKMRRRDSATAAAAGRLLLDIGDEEASRETWSRGSVAGGRLTEAPVVGARPGQQALPVVAAVRTTAKCSKRQTMRTVAAVGIIDTALAIDQQLPPTARPDVIQSAVGATQKHSAADCPGNSGRIWLATASSSSVSTPRIHSAVGRWRGSRGRLLSYDDSGAHNRSHDRRHSFPPPRPGLLPKRDAQFGSASFNARGRTTAIGASEHDSERAAGAHERRRPSPGKREQILTPREASRRSLGASRGSTGLDAVSRSLNESETVGHSALNSLVQSASGAGPSESLSFEWGDPFIPQRRVLLEKSRRLRAHRSVFGILEADGRLRTTTRDNQNKNKTSEGSRKSSQISRLVPLVNEANPDNLDIFMLTGLVEQAELQLQTAREKKRQDSSQGRENPLISYEVPWDIPTKIETLGEDGIVNSDNMVARLGHQLAHTLHAKVVGPTMDEMRWGDRKVPLEHCGLLELDQSLDRLKKRNVKFVEAMEETKTYFNKMATPKNKSKLLDGRVVSHANMREAENFVDHLNIAALEEQAREKSPDEFAGHSSDPAYDADNITSDNLDEMLKNLMLKANRGAMFAADRRPGRHLTKQLTDEDGENKIEPEAELTPEQDGRFFMSASEVLRHSNFHRELDYTRFKTDEFKKDITNQMIGVESDPTQHRRKAIQNGFRRDKSIHYLHFTIMSAEYLPIWDESKSTSDAYVRCSLYYGDTVLQLSGSEPESTVCTPIAFDTKKPSWDTEMMFTVPFHASADVHLLLEVMDAAHVDTKTDDIDDEVCVPSDVFIGQVSLPIMSAGIQIMCPERLCTDVHILVDKQGEEVRDNFGVTNAVLMGRNSTLETRYIYTKRPRRSVDDYVVLLQCNIRIMCARRAAAHTGRMIQRRKIRDDLLPEFLATSDIDYVWNKYKEKCKELGTQAISKLHEQLASGGIILSRYHINITGMKALADVITTYLSESRLTKISLTHLNINSAVIKILTDAICGVDDCPLLVLILDGNPLSREPCSRADGSRHRFDDLALDNLQPRPSTEASSPIQPRRNSNSFGADGAQSVARIVQCVKGLVHLSLAGCQLGNSGIVEVAERVRRHKCLRRLDLSDNEIPGSCGEDMLRASETIGELVRASTTLVDLAYASNNLNSKCGLALLGGAPWQYQGMMVSKFLRTLNISKTGVCRTKDGVATLAKILSKEDSGLESLDISYCGLTAKFMKILSDGLNVSTVIKKLILDGNSIQSQGDGYTILMCRYGRKRYILDFEEKASDIHSDAVGNLSRTCVPAQEVQRLFDQFSDMGALRFTDRDNMKRLLDSLGFDWDEEKIKKVYTDIDLDHSDTVDFGEFYRWYLDEMKVAKDQTPILEISLKNCGYIPKDANFDPHFPSGDYCLDMHFLRSRNILRSLMRMVFVGTGVFVADSGMRITTDASGVEQIRPHTVEVSTDISSWDIPDHGWLNFSFQSKRVQAGTTCDWRGVRCLNDDDMNKIKQTFQDTHSKSLHRASILEQHLFNKNKVHTRQAETILQWFPKAESRKRMSGKEAGMQALAKQKDMHGLSITRKVQHDWERVDFVARVLPILQARRRNLRILESLEEWERREVQERMCILPRNTCFDNLTGYYRFNLNLLTERDVCISLVAMVKTEMREAIICFRDEVSRHKEVGGMRDRLDFVFQNPTLNGRALNLSEDETIDFAVPFHGTFQADFVDIRKPASGSKSLTMREFLRFVSEIEVDSLPARQKMDRILQISSQTYFSCLEVMLLQRLFDGDDIAYRAEVAVCLFSRTIDWRAYDYVVKYAGRQQQQTVRQRLGHVNLFHDGMSTAVGNWDLDLSMPDQRFILQELLYQSVKTPQSSKCLGSADRAGRNMIDCEYNGSPYAIPKSWLDGRVPRDGRISFFYGRSKESNDKSISLGSRFYDFRSKTPPPCKETFPPNFTLPSVPADFVPGDSSTVPWIMMEKIRLVKVAMQNYVDDVEDIFKALDVDGSGSLDRAEFSKGLVKVGILLKPSEMKLLLEAVDCDKSGDISLQELKTFWKQAPPLRMNDEAQAQFWNQRGFRGKVYDGLVPFYDLRAHYPSSVIQAYGLSHADALSQSMKMSPLLSLL